jgi:hypothetical protein
LSKLEVGLGAAVNLSGSLSGATVAAPPLRLVHDLQKHLKAADSISPSPDIATYLWRNFSLRGVVPDQALAGRIMLQAIVQPNSLPGIISSLRAAVPATQAAEVEAVALNLAKMSGRYRNSPQAVEITSNLTEPLLAEMARAIKRSNQDQRRLRPVLDAIFTGSRHTDDDSSIPPLAVPDRSWSYAKRAQVALNGAGMRNFGLAVNYGGVKPMDRVVRGFRRRETDKSLHLVQSVQVPGPRVLTQRELEILEPGRAAGPRTMTEGESAGLARQNFKEAAGLVNDWVRSGKDLDFAMILQLNRVLRRGLRSYRGAVSPGHVRVADKDQVGHYSRGHRRRWLEYALPKRVMSYLVDFMIWYKANRDTMHPVEFAARAYQQLVRIQVFGDGNHRTSRLVMDFILQSNGYLPPVFDKVSGAAVYNHTSIVIQNASRAIRQSRTQLMEAPAGAGS